MPKVQHLLTLRAAVLLTALLAANTLCLLLVYRHYLYYVIAPRQGAMFAATVQHIRSDFELVPEARHDEWLTQFNERNDVMLEKLESTAIVDHPLINGYLQSAQAVLLKEAGEDVRIGFVKPTISPTVTIDFNVQGQRLRLSMLGAGMSAPTIWGGIWVIGANGFIVVAVVLFMVAQVNRPLRRTAAALAQSTDYLATIEMPASAPAEFRIFALRFNELASRLRAQEKERALLLASVSHDLRAPLTRIRVNAEMVDDLIPGKGDRILQDSESMRHIIDQFLDHQRGINPRLVAPTDIRSLVETNVERHRDVGYDVRHSGDATATLLLDSTAVERILNNLIDNAVTYGEEPVEVETFITGPHIAIRVRDHGSGIEESAIERVLQPFERLDEARTAFGHCGLGLTIVTRLVRQLGGKLLIDNHPDGGLQVSIHLLLHEPATPLL